jgi:hypothetical protein
VTVPGGIFPNPAISDSAAAPILMALRDCLCREVAKTIFGSVCRCYVAWGAVLPMQDGCFCTCEPDGNGDAWVKLDSLDPDLSATSGAGVQGWCPTGWVATLSMGIYRCIPVGEADEVLDHTVVTDTSLALLSDMASLWRAFSCCESVIENGVRVATWTPIDPAGGCAGGALTIQVPLAGSSSCS